MISRFTYNISLNVQFFSDWTVENGSTINLNKTKAMIFGTAYHISQVYLDTRPEISVNGIEFEYVTEAKRACEFG